MSYKDQEYTILHMPAYDSIILCTVTSESIVCQFQCALRNDGRTIHAPAKAYQGFVDFGPQHRTKDIQ